MRKVMISATIFIAGLLLTRRAAASGQAGFDSTAWHNPAHVNVLSIGAVPITIVPDDTVEIVDRVRVTHTRGVTFTPVETRSETPELVGWTGDTNSFIATTDTLTWDVRHVAPNTWHAVTGSFGVQGGDWAHSYVTKTLTVEKIAPHMEDQALVLAQGGVCLPVNVASLDSDSPVDLGQTMSFTATVLGSTPIIYTWDYGDGTPLDFDVGLDTVTHTYGADGLYTATLNVVNGCPSSGRASMPVAVNPPPPEPAWDKQVHINGVLTNVNPITVVPGDMVEIVDRVWVTATRNVTFTLVETWTESLDLVSWVGDTPAVTNTARVLTWSVVDGTPSVWHTFTRTFSALTGTWDTDAITGNLRVEGTDSPPGTWILHFNHVDPGWSPSDLVYLPLILRRYPVYHQVADAPDACPGLPIEIGGHLYGESFDHANDNDWYWFTAQAGLTYDIHTFDLGTRADTVLALYDTDCTTLLAQNDDVEPNDVSSQVEWQAPTDGEYHVNIRHYNWTVYGAGTGYILQVTR